MVIVEYVYFEWTCHPSHRSDTGTERYTSGTLTMTLITESAATAGLQTLIHGFVLVCQRGSKARPKPRHGLPSSSGSCGRDQIRYLSHCDHLISSIALKRNHSMRWNVTRHIISTASPRAGSYGKRVTDSGMTGTRRRYLSRCGTLMAACIRTDRRSDPTAQIGTMRGAAQSFHRTTPFQAQRSLRK